MQGIKDNFIGITEFRNIFVNILLGHFSKRIQKMFWTAPRDDGAAAPFATGLFPVAGLAEEHVRESIVYFLAAFVTGILIFENDWARGIMRS